MNETDARHIEALKAQTGPAYLFHRPVGHFTRYCR